MIPMTYSDTYEAIIEHLKTFPDLPLDNIQVSNMPVDGEGAFVIPDTDVWARMTVNYGQTFISGLADNPVTRRVGVLSFQLFGERGYGEYPLLDLAEKLTQHFQFHRVSFLEFLTGSTANISASGGLLNSSNDVSSGEWHQVNVNFTFRVYTNGAKNTPTPPPPPPPVEPPVLLSKVVSTNGLSVVLTFDKAITVNNLILDVGVNGANRTYTHTVNGAVLTITPSSVIYQSETVSIAYASGIEDLEPFTTNTVNDSSVVKPVSDPILAHFTADPTLNGFYFDPNDWSTLFQDAAGTIPVTAVGQTVGKMLDKSGNGNHWVQTDVTKQYKLGQDSTTNSCGLLGDGVDDITTISVSNMIFSNSVSFGVGLQRVSTGFVELTYNLKFGSSNRHVLGLGENNFLGSGGAFYSEPNTATGLQLVVVPANGAMKGVVSTSRTPSELTNLYLNTVKYQSTISPVNLSSANLLDAKIAGYMYKGFLMNKKLNDFEHQEIHNFINLDVEAY